MKRNVPIIQHLPVILDDFKIEYATNAFTLYHVYIPISHHVLLSVVNLGPMYAMANEVTMATNYEVMLTFPRFNKLVDALCMHMKTPPGVERRGLTLPEVNKLAGELRALV
jgi:hypothetical protein